MAKPGKIKEIELREGKPIDEILKGLYEQYGSQVKVARALGVGQTTVSLWLLRLGLVERTTLVPKERV